MKNGVSSVFASKRPACEADEAWRRQELYPTPPWATRALARVVLPRLGIHEMGVVYDPCAGLGHMSDVLALEPSVRGVVASDLYDYAASSDPECVILRGVDATKSADMDAVRAVSGHAGIDWVVTNPPFGLADKILSAAWGLPKRGVALLVRNSWLESQRRYRDIFERYPPTLVAVFSERVPMCGGGYDPKMSTAACYVWAIWLTDTAVYRQGAFDFGGMFIPPMQSTDLFDPAIDDLLAARHVAGWVSPTEKLKMAKLGCEDDNSNHCA